MPRLEGRGLLLAVVATLSASAFDPSRDIGLAVQGGVLMVRIPDGVHLKRNAFKVALKGAGRLQTGPLPAAQGKDEAEDPIWRGAVRIPLTGEGLADPVELVVTLQPCTEGKGGVCYLPQRRALSVPRAEIPAPTGKL